MNSAKMESFIQAVVNGINERLGNVVVHTGEVIKNNGIKMNAVTIIGSQSNISPCIYLDEYYAKVTNGAMDIAEAVDSVVEIYKNNVVDCDFDTDIFTDYDKAGARLHARLINTEKNEELLLGLPHRDFLDLSIIYVVELEGVGHGLNGSIRVTNEHMRLWGVTEEMLYSQVKENMEMSNECSITKLSDMFCALMGGNPEQFLPGEESELYIITNSSKVNGAVEIINERTLKEFASMVGNDFIVLPSSVHECLLLPVGDDINNIENLAQIVKEVNDTQLSPNEILSYHVYKYDNKTGTLAIAA